MNRILATKGDSVRAISAELVENGSGNEPPPVSWRQAMRLAVRDLGDLCNRLSINPDLAVQGQGGAADFPMFVPLEYLSRIRLGDPKDPLLRQVLPRAEETDPIPGYSSDPLAEREATRVPGLLQKYAGRALLVTTGACAIHCRYCFRRHFPYQEVPKSVDSWTPALQQIATDPEIDEILLSGGDPLTLVDSTIDQLVTAVDAITHVQRLRVHTRLPVVIPQRVTDQLLRCFQNRRVTTWFVVHINHPNELDQPTLKSLQRLIDAGFPVLNQSVLLRGVNDSADVLERLCRSLVNHRVQPYYLHHLDRVSGAHHFKVPKETGRKILSALRQRLPGYAVPQYVQEVPGEQSKLPITVN